MLEYCPTDYIHMRVKRAVSVFCVKGQSSLGQQLHVKNCPTEYNHTRVKKAVSVFCVKGQSSLWNNAPSWNIAHLSTTIHGSRER